MPQLTMHNILLQSRFMDEQDVARDRSVSPNYHSLIYGVGDSKRKNESKTDVFNGADKSESRPGQDSDDATLTESSTY